MARGRAIARIRNVLIQRFPIVNGDMEFLRGMARRSSSPCVFRAKRKGVSGKAADGFYVSGVEQNPVATAYLQPRYLSSMLHRDAANRGQPCVADEGYALGDSLGTTNEPLIRSSPAGLLRLVGDSLGKELSMSHTASTPMLFSSSPRLRSNGVVAAAKQHTPQPPK